MLVELSQHQGYASTAREMARIFREIKRDRSTEHPILEDVQTASLDSPTLMFDLQAIAQRMQRLQQTASHYQASVLLAVKSSPSALYLEQGKRWLNGFDVSNLAEYQALPDNLQGKLVSVTSPDLSANIERFVSKGNDAIAVLDSEDQLQQFLRQQSGVQFLLRLNVPDLLELRQLDDGLQRDLSRFGFNVARVFQLLKGPLAKEQRFAGFHFHDGSEINNCESYLALIKALGLMTRQAEFEPRYINLGGGFHRTSLNDVGEILGAAKREFSPSCRILLEPGHYFSKRSGFAACRIVNQTMSADVIKVTVNLSKDCHLKWSRVKLLLSIDPRARKLQEVEIFGPTCYEEDRIGRFLVPFHQDLFSESGFAPGKQLFFSDVSIYSAAWNTSFNGIPKADVQWWDGSSAGSEG